MRGRYFQWKEMAMLSRIFSGLVQEKDKFFPVLSQKNCMKARLSLINLIIPISVRDSVDFIHKYVGHLGLYLRF